MGRRLLAPSMNMSVFMDGQSFLGQSGAGQPPSEAPPGHIALLHGPKTADGASQSPPEALSGQIALLHLARRRREEVTGSQAVRRKPQTEQETNENSGVLLYQCRSHYVCHLAAQARNASFVRRVDPVGKKYDTAACVQVDNHRGSRVTGMA